MRAGHFALYFLALLLLAVGAAPTTDPSAWIRQHARPFATTEPRANHSDLDALRSIVGSAHIVGLGECTHGTRECFQMKHRITEFLATEMGFHLFAIEANMPEAYRVNDYVLTGRGDPRALIRGMYFWTWQTEEVLAMVEWMRAFNASGRGQIQFLGFDMQTPDTAAAIVRRFVARSEPTYLATLDSAWSQVRRARMTPNGFDTATGTFPTAAAAGHHIEFSGLIRTQRVTQWAGLWWRADTPERQAAAFSNMSEQGIGGSRDWKRYSLALDIPANTNNINFGMLMAGTGEAWFDSLAIFIDGKPWTGNGEFDLALEDAGGPIGFGRGSGPWQGYRIAMDDRVAAVGQRSLKIASVAARDTTGPSVDYWAAFEAAHHVVDHLERNRATLARGATTAEVDWAAQNARVVEQAMSAYSAGESNGKSVRDSCMARNVDWILAHAAKGERIVLWAHNWHVSRRASWMGDHLARRHGADYRVIGFATARGTYRAMGTSLSSDNVLMPAPSGSLEDALSRAGPPRYLIDVRAQDPAARDWFEDERRMRSIGALSTSNQFWPARVGKEFDAIVWVDSTSAAVPMKDR